MTSSSQRIALIAGLSLAFIMAVALLASTWFPSNKEMADSRAASVELQVPTATSGVPPDGKQGEVAPPTPFPTVVLPEMTPVPPGGDKDFDATPTPGYFVPPTPQPSDPIHLQVAAGMVPLTVDQATNEAQVVVMGVVKQVGPARWTTPDGSRPADPHAQSNRDYIVTPITIQVTNALKGGSLVPGTELTLQAFGGQVGRDKVEWLHDKDNLYRVGQQVLVFLAAPGGADALQTIEGRPAWMQVERYTVDPEDKARNWHSNIPVQQLLDQVRNAAQTPPNKKP